MDRGIAGKASHNDNWGPASVNYGNFGPSYTTCYGGDFYNKGDPEKIRAKLDEDAKRILRRTNFHYGLRPVSSIFSKEISRLQVRRHMPKNSSEEPAAGLQSSARLV
jgi:hypothetical protein